MAIKINPDEMRGIATEFDNKMVDFDALMNALQGLTDRLVSGWEGAASDGYQQRFTTIKEHVDKQMKDLVDEIVKNLNTVANEMEQFDKDIGSKFGG